MPDFLLWEIPKWFQTAKVHKIQLMFISLFKILNRMGFFILIGVILLIISPKVVAAQSGPCESVYNVCQGPLNNPCTAPNVINIKNCGGTAPSNCTGRWFCETPNSACTWLNNTCVPMPCGVGTVNTTNCNNKTFSDCINAGPLSCQIDPRICEWRGAVSCEPIDICTLPSIMSTALINKCHGAGNRTDCQGLTVSDLGAASRCMQPNGWYCLPNSGIASKCAPCLTTPPKGSPYKACSTVKKIEYNQCNSCYATGPTRDIFSDPQKVNEYVSWYLNGVIGRAEYPPLDPAGTGFLSRESVDKIVSTSGPVNRLLPQAFLQSMRIESIAEASRTNPVNGKLLQHNQIVVCASSKLGIFGDLFGIGTFVPHECYPNAEEKADPRVFRLKPADALKIYGWGDEPLSIWNTIINNINRVINWISILIPSVPKNIIRESLLDHWNKRVPPLPWGTDQQGNPMTAIKYRKYYNEWRGRTCVLVPVTQFLYCFDNIFVPNRYADLFPYIPLSNTTDKNALHLVLGVQLRPNKGTIAYYIPMGTDNPDIIHEPVLFYPHTLETVTLSDQLNKVFTPKHRFNPGEEENSPNQDFEDVGCNIVNLRSNPGDRLFQSSQDSRIDDLSVYVNVRVEAVGCPAGPINGWLDNCGGQEQPLCSTTKCTIERCGSCIPPLWPGECTTYPMCLGNVSFKIPTLPKIPYAAEIWKSTVISQDSSFRRIFPKVSEGAPVSCIADIEGITSTSYVPLPNKGYTPLVSVETPLDVHKSADNSVGMVKSELYLPYQGTVYEYFLKGIQTALRPKGFGAPIPNGTQCFSGSTKCGNLEQKYHVPICQLEGVIELETNGGNNVGNERCTTKNGNFNCCSGNVCGPAQISCSQYDAFTGNDNIDMCDMCGAQELLARAMLLKLCQADGVCDSYDWTKWGNLVLKNYKVQDGDYTAACYFYGLATGCFPTACTQYRWGAGKSYGDAVESYCKTGKILPDNTDMTFCEACAQEDPRLTCN